MKRKCHSPIGLLSTQAHVRVWCQRQVKATGIWRLNIEKGFGYCKEPSMGKIGTQLGRAISYHIRGWGSAYYLEDLEENVVPRPWNVNNLRRYYY